MSRTSSPDVEEMSEAEKDRLLRRLAEKVDDPVMSRVYELAAQASPPEESN